MTRTLVYLPLRLMLPFILNLTLPFLRIRLRSPIYPHVTYLTRRFLLQNLVQQLRNPVPLRIPPVPNPHLAQ